MFFIVLTSRPMVRGVILYSTSAKEGSRAKSLKIYQDNG